MTPAARSACAAILCGWLVIVAVPAASETVREDPLEASVRDIAERLRCPVCQGENLYDSQSGLAAEMRDIIRDQLAADRSEDEIVAFFVDRYGDYVRLAPRWGGGQLIVWLAPLLAFAVGAAGVTLAIRRRARASGANERQ